MLGLLFPPFSGAHDKLTHGLVLCMSTWNLSFFQTGSPIVLFRGENMSHGVFKVIARGVEVFLEFLF